MADGEKTPPPIEMADAHHAVVVLLVDPKMVIEKAAWNPFITALWAEAEKAPERHRVFPPALACRLLKKVVMDFSPFLKIRRWAEAQDYFFYREAITSTVKPFK